MADPTPAAYRLFSWMRQGLLASINQAPGSGDAATPGGLVLPIRLRINNTRDVDVPLHLYGPEDVTGLDAREVIRTEPQPLMTDFEPNYFPSIEFDRPDFPWLFTPAVPDGNRRLVPWICLVVVKRDAATLGPGAGHSLPVLDCPRRELPNLSESWAWAHAQDSDRFGNSRRGQSRTGSEWPAPGPSVAASLLTTTRQIHGTSRRLPSGTAGVNSHGKSGRSNSIDGK